MAFAQHSRNSSSQSPGCHKTYHKTILVTIIVTMFPCICSGDSAGPVTGHWCDDGGWCLAWSPLGTQLHLMTTSPRSWPWDCQDLSHQQSIQCQADAHAHTTLPPALLRALGGDLQWRHGAGVGFGQGSAVSRVLIWTPGPGREGEAGADTRLHLFWPASLVVFIQTKICMK